MPVDFTSQKGLPVVNISGCPVHPGWVAETVAMITLNQFTKNSMDSLGRPRFYAEKLVHHGCSRNEYYEYKASAENPSDLGCMMENMGCIGTIAHADCNERPWNGSGSCTKGGDACVDCTSPDFGHVTTEYQSTPKISGIPLDCQLICLKLGLLLFLHYQNQQHLVVSKKMQQKIILLVLKLSRKKYEQNYCRPF